MTVVKFRENKCGVLEAPEGGMFCPRKCKPSKGETEQKLPEERLAQAHLGLKLKKLEMQVHPGPIQCIKVRLLHLRFYS